MASWKEIKSRIKSVSNTRKITKAMELIYTVKMKKAQESVMRLRPFAMVALEILASAIHSKEVFSSYSSIPESEKELIVMIASQKWLCGSYNVSAYKKTVEYIEYDEDTPYTRIYEYITIGKHARDFVLRTGQKHIADFSVEIGDALSNQDVRKVTRFLIEEWKTWKYAKITIIYNNYISAIAYEAIARTFLPLVPEEIVAYLDTTQHTPMHLTEPVEHTIEPDIQTLIDITLPMILEAQLREILSESRASEYSARMIAMKNASDSAHKKVGSLTLVYNKTRQAAITKEVSEIVSGVESMKE